MSTSTEHKIVAVDSWVKPPSMSFEYEQCQYPNTSSEELPERIKDATIVITSATRVTRAAIESAPNLELIACNGTGTDHVDKEAAKEHGVAVCRVPAQNTDSVSEHAFALYYAIRRRVVEMHELTMDGESWATNQQLALRLGKPPRTNAEEILVVVGYGALGTSVGE